MKQFIIYILIFIVGLTLWTINPSPIEAQQPEVQDEQLTVEELVTKYADLYGVSQSLAHYIAKNESDYGRNPNDGDMNITCPAKTSPFYGQPVRARGVMQLTQCWYYHVSDEEAYDPETNIRIAMEVIAQGEKTCRSQFTTCDTYYKTR